MGPSGAGADRGGGRPAGAGARSGGGGDYDDFQAPGFEEDDDLPF